MDLISLECVERLTGMVISHPHVWSVSIVSAAGRFHFAKFSLRLLSCKFPKNGLSYVNLDIWKATQGVLFSVFEILDSYWYFLNDYLLTKYLLSDAPMDTCNHGL